MADDFREGGEKKKKNSSTGKTAIISFAVMVLIIGGLFSLFVLMAGSMDDTPVKSELSPEDMEFFAKLDVLYDEGDYEGLVKLANGPGSDNIDIVKYGHYDFLNCYSQYIMLRDEYIPRLDKGEMNRSQARYMTESVFSFYYRCYDQTQGSLQSADEKDLKILDDIRENYILDILYNRMGYTKEDMEAVRGDIVKGGWLNSSEADRYSDRYCERYK